MDQPSGPRKPFVVEGSGEKPPFILVRAAQHGSPWYLQPAVEQIDGGHAAVQVRFGSDKTRPGEEFLVRLALPNEREPFVGILPGQPIEELPDKVDYSRDISLKYDPLKQPTTTLAKLRLVHASDQTGSHVRIVFPFDESSVSRRVNLIGRFQPSKTPILLVRRAEGDPNWYVQPRCNIKGGRFECRIYLGQLGTDVGTRFEVVAMLVPNNEVLKYPAGVTLKRIPTGAEVSTPLILVHNGNDD